MKKIVIFIFLGVFANTAFSQESELDKFWRKVRGEEKSVDTTGRVTVLGHKATPCTQKLLEAISDYVFIAYDKKTKPYLAGFYIDQNVYLGKVYDCEENRDGQMLMSPYNPANEDIYKLSLAQLETDGELSRIKVAWNKSGGMRFDQKGLSGFLVVFRSAFDDDGMPRVDILEYASKDSLDTNQAIKSIPDDCIGGILVTEEIKGGSIQFRAGGILRKMTDGWGLMTISGKRSYKGMKDHCKAVEKEKS